MADVVTNAKPNTTPEQSGKTQISSETQRRDNSKINRLDIKDFMGKEVSDERLNNDIRKAQKQSPTESKPNSSETIDNRENVSKVYEISTKKTMSLQNGRGIYKVSTSDGLAICDANGKEYTVTPHGDVNVSIAFGYKMTLYVKDKETNKLLLGEDGKPQTIVIINTANAENEKTIVLSSDKKKEQTKNEVNSNVTTKNETATPNTVSNQAQDNRIDTENNPNVTIRSQEPDEEHLNTTSNNQPTTTEVTPEYNASIKKQNLYRDNYGRTYNLFEGTLPQGLRLSSVQNGRLVIHGDNKFTLYTGQNKTLYVVNNVGQRLKDDNGHYISYQVSNGQNSPSEVGFTIDNVTTNTTRTVNTTTTNNNVSTKKETEQKNEQEKQSNKVVLGDGLATLEAKQEQTVVRELQRNYYGYTYWANVRRNVNYTEATLSIPNDSSICLKGVENISKNVSEDGTHTNYTFRLNKPESFGIIKDNQIVSVYTINPENKSLEDITDKKEGKVIINSYVQRPLPLTNTNETVLNAGNYVTLDRDNNHNITNININTANDYSANITINNGVAKDQDGSEVTNIKLQANGTMTYNTRMTIDGKSITTVHEITKDGVHTEQDYYATIYDAKAKGQQYREFGPSDGNENLVITRNQRSIGDATLLSDAEKTIKNAMAENAMPEFLASYHGSRDYNTGVGRDSKWLRIIRQAAENVGYDGPIAVLIQHCHSGVSQAEIAELAKFPAGSFVIKSQDQNLSYYQPNNPHSVDGSTLEEARHASILGGVAYFIGRIVSANNNPTAAVVTSDGKVQVFSERGNYPGCTPNSSLPTIDRNETDEILKNSGVNEQTRKFYLGNGKVMHWLRFVKHAANQNLNCPFEPTNAL